MSTTETLSVWDTLSAVDCSQKIEKKGKLSYLSWAWAWAEVKKLYPEANYSFEPPIFFGDGTCEVWCSVTIGEQTHKMWLPVMDNKNQSVANPNSRALSDTRMRCLVKGLAMHGLGHYIYAGEDLPDMEATQKVTPPSKEAQALMAACDANDIELVKNLYGMCDANSVWPELAPQHQDKVRAAIS